MPCPSQISSRQLVTRSIRASSQLTHTQQNDNGLSLLPTSSLSYMSFLASTASSHNLAIGLKNSLDIVPALAPLVDFAVNEQCVQLGECAAYAPILALGKPVFNIEYPVPLDARAVSGVSCTGQGVSGLSTVMKDVRLDGRSWYCDGGFVDTPTVGGGKPPRPSASKSVVPSPSPSPRTSSSSKAVVPSPSPSRRTSSRPPVESSRPATASRPLPVSTKVSSATGPPTSTPGGCRAKHWDQCGGNDWKGCMVCEVSLMSFEAGNEANVGMWGRRRIRVRECRCRIIISVFRLAVVVTSCALSPNYLIHSHISL
jgi:hypothetical protein